jgi:hypothetical protein
MLRKHTLESLDACTLPHLLSPPHTTTMASTSHALTYRPPNDA